MTRWLIFKRTSAGLFPHGTSEGDTAELALLGAGKQNLQDGREYTVVREDCLFHFAVDLKVTVRPT